MAERSNIDQLDDALAAIAEGRQLDLTTLEPQVSALADIARGLFGLPRESFKAELEQQLRGRDAMSSPAQQLEQNQVRSISIHLCVANGSAAIDFYRAAFGATELMRLAEPDGKIGHAQLQIGNLVLSLSDEYPDYGTVSPQTIGGSPIKMHLDVADVDAFAEQALKAGATLVRPISDQFYGDRSGQIADPFGYTWIVSTHIKDVPIEDMQKEVDKFAQEEAAKKEKKLTRPNLRTVTPYFTVHRPAELIDFVTKAFGAVEHFRTTGSAGGMHGYNQHPII